MTSKERLELLQGTLDMLILKSISVNPMHGFGISVRIRQMSQEVLQVEQGSLYPALHTLTKEGYLQTEAVQVGNRTRKYYKLTSSGKGQVRFALEELLDFAQTLKTIFEPKMATA